MWASFKKYLPGTLRLKFILKNTICFCFFLVFIQVYVGPGPGLDWTLPEKLISDIKNILY